jgi:uncharacterized SAM-binding protein YcdF (DUF218 family)
MALFTAEKALGQLVMPVGIIWLLMLAVGMVCLRRRRWGSAALWLGIAVLYAAAGNIYVGGALMASLEQTTRPVQVESLQPFDAVFVLGGGGDQDEDGNPELSRAGDRIFLAARLWHAGKARVLVASGMARDGVHGIEDGGQETRTLWRAVGIPDQAILPLAEPCWITRDEINAYARLQARYGWRRMALVSSASHLPRAMALAAKAGLRVTPLGADRVGRGRRFQWNDLVPQGLGFETTQRACWEYLGRWVGR